MRLVICDDHRLLLDTIAGALTARGFTVEALVTTADEAVQAVLESDPDVAILDVHLANGDSLAATAEIARSHPRTKVLLLSASTDPELVRAGIEAGAAGYVRKDQSIDGIVRRLELVASGEVAFDLGVLRTAVYSTPNRTPAHQLLRRLSQREREVLGLLVEGCGTTDIARRLRIADSTARTHVQNVLVKVGAHSRLQVAAIASQTGLAGLLEPPPPASRQKPASST
jgi:DNA-binding NarL/FixJ family response regulator